MIRGDSRPARKENVSAGPWARSVSRPVAASVKAGGDADRAWRGRVAGSAGRPSLCRPPEDKRLRVPILGEGREKRTVAGATGPCEGPAAGGHALPARMPCQMAAATMAARAHCPSRSRADMAVYFALLWWPSTHWM